MLQSPSQVCRWTHAKRDKCLPSVSFIASGDKKTAHIDDAQRKESTPLAPQMTPSAYYSTAGPSYVPHPAAGSAAPTVYNYYSPLTQQHVASLLPPGE